MSRANERQRAKKLNAADATTLIRTKLPSVLKIMTPAQIDQVQRVLDAAVVNPDVQKEVARLDRDSIRSQSGDLVHRDPDKVRKTQQEANNFIPVSESQKYVRVDPQNLLAADAFLPTTDNPDEAAFLLHIKNAIAQRGVWVHVDKAWFSGAAHNTGEVPPLTDPRAFTIGLRFGFEGSVIPIGMGPINRKVLLGTPSISASYFESVDLGPSTKALDRAYASIAAQWDTGRGEHWWWTRHRNEYLIVSRVSDTMGGAEWPDESIWDEPHRNLMRARTLMTNGKLMEANKYISLAAMQVTWNARALHEYIEDTTTGAGRAVTILEVAQAAGEVAEFVLTFRAIAQQTYRILSAKGPPTSLPISLPRRVPPTAATGGKAPIRPAAPTPPAATPPVVPPQIPPPQSALSGNTWQDVVDVLSDVLLEHDRKKRPKVAQAIKRRLHGENPPLLRPDNHQLEVARRQARRMINDRNIPANKQADIRRLLDELDDLEAAGRLPAPPPPPRPRRRPTRVPRPYESPID
jgi:hypothetical protein